MIQSVLLLLAPAQRLSVNPSTEPLLIRPMATRPTPPAMQWWRYKASNVMAVIANAMGLLLFLAGLGLVLRLAELLLS